MMEPFRPIVDLFVTRLVEAGKSGVTHETKRVLAGIAAADMLASAGASPLQVCVDRLATSLAFMFEHRNSELELPEGLVPAA